MSGQDQNGVKRRDVLSGIFAVSAVGGAAQTTEAMAKSDRETVDDCIATLRGVLARMHPEVNEVHCFLEQPEDGTFKLSMQGTRMFEEYSGAGVYDVSVCGQLVTFWLEKEPRRRSYDCTIIPGMYVYVAREWLDGTLLDDRREFTAPQIVRKHPIKSIQI